MIRNIVITILTMIISVQLSAKEGNEMPPSNLTEEQKISIIAEMGKAFGVEVDPKDPKTLQAAEAFIVSDAAKAYAFTKIHALPLEYCKDNKELINAKNNYQEKAKDIISLGKYYYEHGYNLKIGDNTFSHTGSELTAALEKMLDEMRSELSGLDEKTVSNKCGEAIKAFESLAMLYGG